MTAPTSRYRFGFFATPDALPEGSSRLWEGGVAESFFLSRAWFDCLVAEGLDPGDKLALGALQAEDGRVLALLPARFTNRGAGLLPARRLRSLTGPYACLFHPILTPDVDPTPIARALGHHLGAAVGSSDIVHLDAVDGTWPELEAFEAGLRAAALMSARYDHFGNWIEPVAGHCFDEYLASRDGSTREIVRRRGRALEKRGARHEVWATIDEMDRGIVAYETVYARSWKQAEPYPGFHERLLRSAARERALRLGVCLLGDRPIAVQLWIVWGGRATVLKLAHDREFDGLSPGSVLLAHLIRHLIEKDAAVEIDFGRGDDAYKRRWASRRRQRIGILAANQRSLAGLGVLTRQLAGRWLSSLR